MRRHVRAIQIDDVLRYLEQVTFASQLHPECPPILGLSHLTRDRSILPVEIMAPPRTAGMPPPGCTEPPTRHSHGRLRSLYRGLCNGPLLQKGRTAPYSAPPALPQAPKYPGSRISYSPKFLVADSCSPAARETRSISRLTNGSSRPYSRPFAGAVSNMASVPPSLG